MPPMSTASKGGKSAHQIVHVPGNTPGGSPGLQTSTGMPGTASGEAAPGGAVAGDFHVKGS